MKITEYKTATADTWTSLDKNVNTLLAQGFQPYGNPYARLNQPEGADGGHQVAQAMVRNGMLENPEPMGILPQTSLAP
jgi:hypothetical protein